MPQRLWDRAQMGDFKAWLVLAVGENRQHGGNSGYADLVDATYVWDSTVPHHADVSVGDAIVLWDKFRLLGASVIEDIAVEKNVPKLLFKCPSPDCGMAGIKARKRASPELRYRCYKCKHEFESPLTVKAKVVEYRSSHDAGWSDLADLLDGPTLRRLCVHPNSQQSLRPLRWHEFSNAIDLASNEAASGLRNRLEALDPSQPVDGGHRMATVRVRLGQSQFRQRLIDQFGATCAFTGEAPLAALEAGHLYSYAQIGTHHEHGGLLMRRDIHRLFDLGFLAVNPATGRVDVHPDLAAYGQYGHMDGGVLRVTIKEKQWKWFDAHWSQHRTHGSA